MKPNLPLLAALLLSLIATASGQNPVPPGPSAVAPHTEFQKWLAELDAQWQATFIREVSKIHEAGLEKLKLQYLDSIQAGVAKASSAGDLDGAVALRNEQKRFSEANEVPVQDDAADAPSVKQLRAGWRAQMVKLENDRAIRVKALHAKYDKVLAQAQTQLTQRQRIDDALVVKAKRGEVAAAWMAGIPAAPPPKGGKSTALSGKIAGEKKRTPAAGSNPVPGAALDKYAGTWTIAIGGYRAPRKLRSDGTLIHEDGRVHQWTVDDKHLTLRYGTKLWEEYDLPGSGRVLHGRTQSGTPTTLSR